LKLKEQQPQQRRQQKPQNKLSVVNLDTLDKYIVVLKNQLTESLCDAILNEYSHTDEWTSTVIGADAKEDKTVRNCDTIQLSQPFTIQNNNIRLKLDKDIFNIVSKCIQECSKLFKYLNVQEDTGYELLRYKQGGFYSQHSDTFLQAPRLMSASLVLNDNYEGGEFAFFDRQLKYKLNKGDVLMFPSTFMFPHEVMPVTKGTRYSIVTWFR
jgi:Rps23 Pro-64 3,4-dihydroxylase Tpa1-like proline 4-hydroxylase